MDDRVKQSDLAESEDVSLYLLRFSFVNCDFLVVPNVWNCWTWKTKNVCTVFPENVTDSTPTSLFTLVFVLAASRGTFRLTLFFFWFFVLVHEVNKTRWWGSMRMNVATLFIKMTSSLARVREALPFHFCPSFFFSSFSVEMGICFHDPKP